MRVIDWLDPTNNDFFLASQFWVAGELYMKRPDLVGFVNGIPLVLVELKKPGVNVREAYDKNLSDYKDTVPQLFHNGFLLVSNGVESKLGSITAKWEHFSDWKKIATEGEAISLETILRGTCDKTRLLDLVRLHPLFREQGFRRQDRGPQSPISRGECGDCGFGADLPPRENPPPALSQGRGRRTIRTFGAGLIFRDW